MEKVTSFRLSNQKKIICYRRFQTNAQQSNVTKINNGKE